MLLNIATKGDVLSVTQTVVEYGIVLQQMVKGKLIQKERYQHYLTLYAECILYTKLYNQNILLCTSILYLVL